MQPFAAQILARVLQLSNESFNDILIFRLKTKLIQRIGLLFCPLRNNNWKYQRGFRSLKDNLESRVLDEGARSNNLDEYIDDQFLVEDIELSNMDYIAEVIDYLINSLSNQYTVVRWSAAKG